MKNFLLSDWAPFLRAAAGRVAYVAACVIVAAEIAYRAGLATGRAVHRLSDLLAGLASGRIDRAQTARAVVSWAQATLAAPESPPAPVAAVITAEHRCAPVTDAPAAGIAAPPIESLTVAQLRAMARARGLSALARHGKRADLIAALV